MGTKTADLMKLDLYKIIGVTSEATDKEIVKSYRKKALKCHPDKNPDNPKAAEEFHLLSRALEILTDAAAKTAYDNILKARKAADLRKQQLDSKRKKFKQDLEDRELAASQERETEVAATRNLEAQIERLRKEGSKLLEEEQERMKEELKKANIAGDPEDSEDKEPEPARLKLKWKAKKDDGTNGGYDEKVLKDIFEKYGTVVALLISRKKKGSAILEYDSPICALKAAENETGLESNPITITWLSGKPERVYTMPDKVLTSEDTGRVTPDSVGGVSSFPSSMPSFGFDPTKVNSSNSMSSCDRDYEDLVLMRLRQAEERKRLMEQMLKEDNENT